MVRTRHSVQLAPATLAGVAGSVTFPSRCCSALIRGMPFERGWREEVAPGLCRALVGDAINVIISIDCSKARCGSGGVEAPPIRARTESDKGSGLSLRIIELCVVPRSVIFFRHTRRSSKRGKSRIGCRDAEYE